MINLNLILHCLLYTDSDITDRQVNISSSFINKYH